MMAQSFTDLGVLPRYAAPLGERNIRRPTDIQARVIPELLEGRSVVFRSATGTGKTFAYLIPLFQRLFPEGLAAAGGGPASGGPLALILAPTYELCSQIRGEAEFLLRGRGEGAGAARGAGDRPVPASGGGGPAVGLLVGSGNLGRQIEGLKKDRPAVLVGNPGRVLLVAKMGKLSFRALRALVFDEGDRLVAEDLRAETMELLGRIAGPGKPGGRANTHVNNRAGGPPAAGDSPGDSPDRPIHPDGRPAGEDGRDREGRAGGAGLLCAACSATLSAKSREFLLPFMGEDSRVIETDEREILRERILHWALWSEGRQKIRTLRSFLAAAKPKKALVFASRSWDAEHIASQLGHLSAAALYGGMEKKRRRDAVGGFRAGTITVLVCSDLAARGLDIPGITHVIALVGPQDAGIYTHRAGRTGRAGKRGIMVSIGDELEMRRLALLEKRLGLTVYPKELYQGRILAPMMEEAPTEESPAGKAPAGSGPAKEP
jgi:superfamily II DNA/RNA helicase